MATLTITIPDPQVPRIQTGVGLYLGIGRDATAQEVQNFLVEVLKDVVRKGEVGQARKDADDNFVPPDVT
jgi:hypothetical protein